MNPQNNAPLNEGEKTEKYQKKVKCKKCFGVGFYSSRYGQTACENCNQRGYLWVEAERKIKSTKHLTLNSGTPDPGSPYSKTQGNRGIKTPEQILDKLPSIEIEGINLVAHGIAVQAIHTYHNQFTQPVNMVSENVEQAAEKAWYDEFQTGNVDPSFDKGFALGAHWQSTQPNPAVAVIKKRIDELKSVTPGWMDSERNILIEEYEHILTLIQKQ